MGYWMYVLCCADDSLYAGITTDVRRRVGEHQDGRGARFTRGRRPVQLVSVTAYPDRSTALQAEAAFKRLRRPEKLRYLADLATSASADVL